MSGDGEPGLLLQDLSGSHSLPLAVETMPCNADMSMRPDRPERDNEAHIDQVLEFPSIGTGQELLG